MKPIVIVGSSNTDLVAKTQRIPVVGETIIGDRFFTAQGGKGANQAVAAAKLGGEVVFVAKLGNDSFGEKSFDSFEQLNIKTTHISRIDGVASGVALISIDNSGRNSIIVVPGANSKLLTSDIDLAENDIKNAGVVVCQLEIPIETVQYTATIAQKHYVPFILDPAPARPLSKELLAMTDILKPNEIEAGELTGIKITDDKTALDAADRLINMGVKTAIITLGSRGLLVADAQQNTFIDRIKVDTVDSTAAGDAFTGALAFGIANGQPIVKAAEYANIVASLSTTKFGAQPSLPTKGEVNSFLAI